MTTRWLPNDAWVRMAIVPVLVFIALVADHGYLADFWHHVARGRAIVERGEIVDRDLFTYTIPGQQFQDVNWLAQVSYFVLFDRGGLELVRIVNAALLAGVLGWLVVLCWRRSGSLSLAAAVGIAVFFGVWQVLTIRPQTFSLLLFVMTYDFLDRAESRPAWLLPIPLLLALWPNLHGAFPAGIMLIGCFLAASAWRGWREGRLFHNRPTWLLLACLAASMLVTLINPYGFGVYEFVGLNSFRSATREVDEWLPPTLNLWIGKAWLASLVVVGGVFLLRCRHRRQGLTARDVVLILCFLPLACRSVRMVPWWLIVIGPMLTSWLAELLPIGREQSESGQPSWGASLALGVLALVAILSLPALQAYNPLLSGRVNAPRTEKHLEDVHRFLQANASGNRIFCRFEWGEYLAWSFSPRYQIFMDGRIDIFPDHVWDEYSTITKGEPDWESILDRYQVTILILGADFHRRSGLLKRVEDSASWRKSFQSGPAVVYLRRTK